VNTARALGEDAAFQARFGDIIPRADVAGVGATIQDHVDTGVPLAKLGASQRQLAESEAQAAIALAKERLGGVPTSANVENFLFDQKSGRIVAWFDHLSHSDLPTHLAIARKNGYATTPSLTPGAPLVLHAPGLPGIGKSISADRAQRWHTTVEEMLATATLVQRQTNSHVSANATQIVTLRAANGRQFRGVWKPASGENATIEPYGAGSPFAGSCPYPLKSLYKNEVRAAKLAAALGLTFLVPPTVERMIDGQRGSLQLFVEGATGAASSGALDRGSIEKLRVFDYVIGNADRTAPNVMLREQGGRAIPIGIDNGLTFPNGTTLGLRERPFPAALLDGHTGPLLAETHTFIGSISPIVVARVLLASGAEARQVAHVLRRLAHLKRDSSFLEIKQPGPHGAAEMLRRTVEAADSRTQGLAPAELEAVNQIITDAQR